MDFSFSGWLKLEVTDTAEFQRWFKNSAVVDPSGKPLVVYKGMYPYTWIDATPQPGQKFARDPQGRPDPGKQGPAIRAIHRQEPFPTFDNDDPEGYRLGGFFGDQNTAGRFASGLGGGAVYPVYLSIQQPYVIDAQGAKAATIQFQASGKPFRDAMRSGRYDGAIITNTADEGTIYVTMTPHQVKSAWTNRTFDPSSPNFDE